MKVEIYGLDGTDDVLVGLIIWDGASWAVNPSANKTLLNLLDEPVVNQDRIITKDEPEAFLANLHKQYRSAYLRASKPME